MTNAKDSDNDQIGNQRSPTTSHTRQADADVDDDGEGQEEADQRPKGWRKQRFVDAQGKEVPLDYFLYSCLEQERLSAANYKDGIVPIRWPLLPASIHASHASAESPELTSDVEKMGLTGLLQRLAAWYRDHHPDIASNLPLDHEQMVSVAPVLVSFSRDVSDLYRVKVGERLPDYERSFGNNKFWDDLEKVVHDYYRTYAHLIMRYVKWSHADEPTEEFIPGSRPPVGRYAPPPPPRSKSGRFGERSQGGGNQTFGNSRGGNGNSRGQYGNDRGNSRPNRFDGQEQPRGERRPPRNQPRNQEGRQDGRGRSQGGGFDRGPKRRSDEETAKLEALAMTEVQQAIETLKSQPSMDEVTLKPANSFYRRIQHQAIVDAGYHSFSVGEGQDRAVKVSRKFD